MKREKEEREKEERGRRGAPPNMNREGMASWGQACVRAWGVEREFVQPKQVNVDLRGGGCKFGVGVDGEIGQVRLCRCDRIACERG